MRIAFIAGLYSTQVHGRIDADGLYETRALTGSESSFFNAAWGLSELGHEVDIYCDVISPVRSCRRLAGANVYSIHDQIPDNYDACISLNEPQQLARVPKALRIVQQQLNDFFFTRDFDSDVDIYAFLSPLHRQFLLRVHPEIDPSKATWIPNSTNLAMYNEDPSVARVPHSMTWCSSPDRGLHRLLEIFPAIRKRIPDATLNIFYRFDPWYEKARTEAGKLGSRARFIGECLRRLGSKGENGVTLVGPIANTKMAKALLATEILPYTCECISFTEGFSVSIMDACAAGCVPIISDADAIGDIYRTAAHVIMGKPGENPQEWVEAIVRGMTDLTWAKEISSRARAFTQQFDRLNIARYWEALIEKNLQHTGNEYTWSVPRTMEDFILNKSPTINAAVSDGGSGSPSPITPAHSPMVPATLAAPPTVPTILAAPPTMIASLGKLHRMALIMGRLSSSVHGIFDIDALYDTGMLTGTGSGFFDIAWGLAERGHTIDVFCEAKQKSIAAPLLAGANVYPLGSVKMGNDYDAYISVNEPDPLREAPPDRLRICVIWLNDFSFAEVGYDKFVDIYVSPSETHARHLCRTANISPDKVFVVPLSVSLEFFNEIIPRRPTSMAYCSSPDRGLHHVLDFFPEIKRQVPEATLRVYYRFQPWYDSTINDRSGYGAPMRKKAEAINSVFEKFGRNGENGLFLVGPVPRKTMARELLATRVLAYPCDPAAFTEGFSISVLDACAAGCVPIVAAIDALPEVYGGAAYLIPGNPATEKKRWIETIVTALTDDHFANNIRYPAKAFAIGFSRRKIMARLEALIYEHKKDTGPR